MITVTIRAAGARPMGEDARAALSAFLLERSGQVILSRRHCEEIEDRLFEELVAEAMGRIFAERDEKLDYIQKLSDRQVKKTGFAGRGQAADLICELAEQRLNQLDECSAGTFRGKDTLEEDLRPFGLVKRQLQYGSLTAEGAWYDLCFFDKDAQAVCPLRDNLFFSPLQAGGYQFTDPCLADESGRVFAKVRSEEKELTLELSQAEYKAFAALGIEHHAYPPQKKKHSAAKAAVIGAASVVSVLGAALGITLAVKKGRKKTEKPAAETE